MDEFRWDVCLSFAGEDRAYVARSRRPLRKRTRASSMMSTSRSIFGGRTSTTILMRFIAAKRGTA